MRLENNWRGDLKGDRSPRYTLTDFARRKNVDPERLHAMFAQTPNHPKPLGNGSVGNSRSASYSLKALEDWWKTRPLGVGEMARELGARYYDLDKVLAAAGVQPVSILPGLRAKRMFDRAAMLNAWTAAQAKQAA